MVNMQIVFQGGGAKLASLLAAAEVFGTYHRQHRIRITRTAGASAGAIAAVCLGLQPDQFGEDAIPRVRRELLAKGDVYFRRTFPKPSTLRALIQIARGKSIYDWNSLAKLLAELIGPETMLSQLRFPTLVKTTSLLSGRAHVLDGPILAVEALAKSCAIPFVFRNVDDLRGDPSCSVDGGLCENLPGDELLKQTNEQGMVVGVSFHERGEHQPLNSVPAFAQSLLNVALANSVHRSVRSIGEQHVLALETSLQTLDFDTFCSAGLADEPYNMAKKQTTEWLEQLIAKSSNKHETGSSRFVIDKNYPLDALSQTLDALSKIHAREQRDPSISEYQVQRTAVVVLANSAADKRAVDRISYITRFRATGSAVRTVKTSVTGPATNRRVRVYRCTDSRGQPLDNPDELNDARWLLLPCSNEMSKQGDGILLYFSPPLQQGCEYELRRTEDVVGAMKDLSDNRREYVSNHNQHGASIQHADIVIGISSGIQILTSTSDGANELKQSDGVRELNQREVDEHYHWATGGTTESWHGFRREGLPTGELFRVDIWRRQP